MKRIANFLGLVRRKQEKQEVYELVRQLAITHPDVNLRVAFLSGGNQQKVVICKGDIHRMARQGNHAACLRDNRHRLKLPKKNGPKTATGRVTGKTRCSKELAWWIGEPLRKPPSDQETSFK